MPVARTRSVRRHRYPQSKRIEGEESHFGQKGPNQSSKNRCRSQGEHCTVLGECRQPLGEALFHMRRIGEPAEPAATGVLELHDLEEALAR